MSHLLPSVLKSEVLGVELRAEVVAPLMTAEAIREDAADKAHEEDRGSGETETILRTRNVVGHRHQSTYQELSDGVVPFIVLHSNDVPLHG